MINDATLTKITSDIRHRVSQLCSEFTSYIDSPVLDQEAMYSLIERANSEGILEEAREWYGASDLYYGSLDSNIINAFPKDEAKTVRYLLYAGTGGYATSRRPYWSKYGLYTRGKGKPTNDIKGAKHNHRMSYNIAKKIRSATIGVPDFPLAYSMISAAVSLTISGQVNHAFTLFFGDPLLESPKNNQSLSEAIQSSFTGSQSSKLLELLSTLLSPSSNASSVITGTSRSDGTGDSSAPESPVSTFTDAPNRQYAPRDLYMRTNSPALVAITVTSDVYNLYTASDITEASIGTFAHAFLTSLLAKSFTACDPTVEMSSIFTDNNHSITDTPRTLVDLNRLRTQTVQRQLADNVLANTDSTNTVISSIIPITDPA